MAGFTLEPRRWYAMELTFPTGERHVSPVLIFGAVPRKTGTGVLEIEFWHASYSEGVQHKTCTLRVLRRTSGYLLAEEGHTTAARALLFRELDSAWVNLHRFHSGRPVAERADLQAAMDRVFLPAGRTAIGL